ncbi:T9SS type A sorting domain-containing protein [Panacibacter ginsenosidivorans]|uniref:T9SS type A sorting domain-containing protein n=1 Tax=Panacibacter ginsenosidivorans TaxID=1813871 RepID=A0A5B8VDK2_9BACT|nr:T9SS type A sorting domain-containing protein [Panacibacter ginsenosidivorans]QEC69520.1 T9SS type A sorting domain-containing protein [Panacibacter ginsenosidivorans]
MRTFYLIPSLLSAFCLTYAGDSTAQKSNAFAVTGSTKGDITWSTVRQIDLSTGLELRSIYSPKDKPAILDAMSGTRVNGAATAPTETLVAATAYDSKTNRLFFTPMHSNELRYFDLSKGTNAVYYVGNTALKSFEEKSEADVITRMCFGADGYGYALTNDANHLIRFTSGSKITISDLGSVKDGEDNENISIRNLCTSWGGDMIADAMGNLYVISMKKNVFKINPQTMVADYIGAIDNMPADYTINGAAVDDKGKVVVSSATRTDNYYSVDLSTLQASAVPKKGNDVYNASDLASGHLAYEDVSDAKVNPAVNVTGNSAVSVYPNPVITRSFQVAFDKVSTATQTIQLSTVSGGSVLTKVINVSAKSITQITLPASVRSGVYIIKVSDGTGKVTYSGKVVVY